MRVMQLVLTERREANGDTTLKCAGHSATIAAGTDVSGELMQMVKAELLSGLMPEGFSVVPTEHRDWLYKRGEDKQAA